MDDRNIKSHTVEAATQLELPELRSKLLDLFCRVAYREGDFVLSSGQPSSYYINGKQVTLHPFGAVAVGRLLLAELAQDTDAVAGLTLGADPLVTATSVVAAYTGRTLIPLIVRKEAKEHGTQSYIEGLSLAPESKIVVLEDVVTTGKSALKAIDRLRQTGYKVNEVIALVDRQQGAATLYAEQQVNFKTIYSIQELRVEWEKQGRQAANSSSKG